MLMARLKIDPNDTLAQEASNKRLKVYTEFSPYFSKDTQVEIATLEQVYFYHKKIASSRVLGEFVNDKKIRRGIRKKVVKHLVKFWDKDFKDNIDLQKKMMLDKTAKLNSKKIKRIHFTFVYLFTLICIISIFLSKRINFLKKTPFIKNYVSKFYVMIDIPFNYNLLIVLIYLSLTTILYIVLLRTYFDVLRKVGNNAEKFIIDEFNKVHANFIVQQKKIRSHLLKSIRTYYKKSYHIKKILDPNVVLTKLEGYSLHVEKKISDFRKKYHWLLFVQFLLKVSVLAIAIYLGYIYYNNYL